MPIVNAPLPPAAATLQSENQQRTVNATQAPDLNNTLAQGMRTLQSTVVRGSDPVQKTGETMVDNNATRRQDSLQSHPHPGAADDNDADSAAAEGAEEVPVRYIKRPSQSGLAARPANPWSPVSVLVEDNQNQVARKLDINA